MMFVVYDVCCLIKFVAYDVRSIMTCVALGRLSVMMFLSDFVALLGLSLMTCVAHRVCHSIHCTVHRTYIGQKYLDSNRKLNWKLGAFPALKAFYSTVGKLLLSPDLAYVFLAVSVSANSNVFQSVLRIHIRSDPHLKKASRIRIRMERCGSGSRR